MVKNALNPLLAPLRSLLWWRVKAKIRQRFPTVSAISTATLANWLEQQPQPLLLDVRRPEEFEVSHLPGARLAPDLATALTHSPEANQPVVVYCSVGYRSARLAAQLQETYGAPVYNLEGSIFQWFNEGRPVVQHEQPVERVHPYNKFWSLLLAPSGSEP
ncbi:MAG TPA: rhodanese-like domain-containing protein [Trichocoleus sp.]